MPSFGAKLKLEREKRKITLEQISISTKIGIRMLQALEEDNFNQLPGGIFNKGFVRAYSRFLGLDEDQTIADYMQASGDPLPACRLASPTGTLGYLRRRSAHRRSGTIVLEPSPSREHETGSSSDSSRDREAGIRPWIWL